MTFYQEHIQHSKLNQLRMPTGNNILSPVIITRYLDIYILQKRNNFQ